MIHDPVLAHELRTPLHGVLAAAALLLDDALTAEQRELAETIREAARALLRLADASLGVGDAAIDAPCDPRAVVDGVRRLLAVPARAKGLLLDVAVDGGVPAVLGVDGGRLRQVLVNLVGNAVTYTARGTVSVRAFRAGDAVRFEVRDSGPGLDVAQQAALFQPRDVPDAAPDDTPNDTPNDAHSSAGLGLSIAAALVRRMGGRIGVESAVGQGSTFWVAIPGGARGSGLGTRDSVVVSDERGVSLSAGRRPRSAAARRARAGAQPASSHRGTDGADDRREQGPLRAPRPSLLADTSRPPSPEPRVPILSVLVLDDDVVGRRVTARMLERLGCRADEVGRVREAEEALRRGRYDVVLLDCALPDGDGCGVARWVRRGEGGGTPVRLVALTASPDAATHARCLAAGMDACLVKPLELDALAAAIGVMVPRGPSVRCVVDAQLARASSDPVIDGTRLDALASLEDDAPGLLARLAADYAASAARQLAAIEMAIVGGDLAALVRAAHAVRGSSASAGAARASALAGAIERAAARALEAPGDAARGAAVTAAVEAVDALHDAVRGAAAALEQRAASHADVAATTPREVAQHA